MTKIRLGLLAIALLGTAAAFAGKSGDTFSYEDANGNPITLQQYNNCLGSTTLCGQKIDDQTQQVVETRDKN
ncbi:MAG: hypothetical protein JSU01_22620 [Bacteroidetes bacterium]|nr:hypothetical protein [Bacteroidota bacterium]